MELSREELKNNVTLRYIDTFVYRFGMGIVPLTTTLNFFIGSMVSSKLLLGVFVALANAFLHLPQIFAGKMVREDKNPTKNYLRLLTMKNISFVSITLAIWFIEDKTIMIIAFYFLYVVNQFIAGTCILYNVVLTADMLPKGILGKYYGYLNLFGNIGDVVGAVSIAYFIVNPFDFPRNYAFLFMIATICSIIATFIVARVKFVVNEKDRYKHESYKEYFGEMKKVFQEDKTFLKFNISKIFAYLGTAIYSFIIIFGKEKLGIGLAEVAIINIVMFCGQALFSIVWGYINTYHSWEHTYTISRSIHVINFVLLLFFPNKTIVYLIYFLNGIALSGFGATQNKALIEMGGKNKALYISIFEMIVVPSTIVAALFIGTSMDMIGFQNTLVISLIFQAFAVIIPMIKTTGTKIEN